MKQNGRENKYLDPIGVLWRYFCHFDSLYEPLLPLNGTNETFFIQYISPQPKQ
jgi:hypothetical protein